MNEAGRSLPLIFRAREILKLEQRKKTKTGPVLVLQINQREMAKHPLVIVKKTDLSPKEEKNDPGLDPENGVDQSLVEGPGNGQSIDDIDQSPSTETSLGVGEGLAPRRKLGLDDPALDPRRKGSPGVVVGPGREQRSLDQNQRILAEKDPSRLKLKVSVPLTSKIQMIILI